MHDPTDPSGVAISPFLLAQDGGQISFDHIAHQGIESCFVAPAELLARLARVAEELIDFSRSEIARIDVDEHFFRVFFDALLFYSSSPPHDGPADMSKRLFNKFAH